MSESKQGKVYIGRRLRLLRAGIGLSIIDLARASGINASSLAYIERGDVGLTPERARLIVKALPINPITLDKYFSGRLDSFGTIRKVVVKNTKTGVKITASPVRSRRVPKASNAPAPQPKKPQPQGRLAALRERLGMSLRGTAEKSGISATSLLKIERGGKITYDQILALARAMGVGGFAMLEFLDGRYTLDRTVRHQKRGH